jgi:hypothetical protein
LIAPAIAILGGWARGEALILWVLLMARAVPSILYVRARLKLERGKPVDLRPAWGAHAIALIAIMGLAAGDSAPRLSVAAMVILLGRALVGLSAWRKARRVPIIGAQEIGYGLLMIVVIAVGYVHAL